MIPLRGNMMRDFFPFTFLTFCYIWCIFQHWMGRLLVGADSCPLY